MLRTGKAKACLRIKLFEEQLRKRDFSFVNGISIANYRFRHTSSQCCLSHDEGFRVGELLLSKLSIKYVEIDWYGLNGDRQSCPAMKLLQKLFSGNANEIVHIRIVHVPRKVTLLSTEQFHFPNLRQVAAVWGGCSIFKQHDKALLEGLKQAAPLLLPSEV